MGQENNITLFNSFIFKLPNKVIFSSLHKHLLYSTPYYWIQVTPFFFSFLLCGVVGGWERAACLDHILLLQDPTIYVCVIVSLINLKYIMITANFLSCMRKWSLNVFWNMDNINIFNKLAFNKLIKLKMHTHVYTYTYIGYYRC